MKKHTFSILALLLAAAFLLASCGGPKTPAKPKKTHNPDTLVVDGSDPVQYLAHNFVDGKCEYCDATSTFRHVPLAKSPEILLTKQPEDKRGTLEEVWYSTRAYGVEARYPDEGEMHILKRAYVYLPAGYDPEDKSKKYNVLYMMHGSGQNEGYWFKQFSFENDDSAYVMGYGTDNMIDYMVANGLCEDIIFVAPTSTSYYADGDTFDPATKPYSGKIDPAYAGIDKAVPHTESGGNFAREFREDLMPFIAEHYNTYAASGSAEDLIAARDHHGFVGQSAGGSVSYQIAKEDFAYVSYYGTLSPVPGGGEFVDVFNEKYKGTYDVNYWYFGFGSTEQSTHDAQLQAYLTIKAGLGLKSGSDIKNGERCEWIFTNGTAHNYATWITSVYNLLTVFFKR